jgi:uncharacterized membrane protein HdeD (DUF308 family)
MLNPMPDANTIRGGWKVLFVLGAIFAILGLVALGHLVAATVVTTVILGFVLLVAGGVQLAGAISGPGGTGARILGFVLAVIYLLVGFDLITDPLKGAVTVAFVIGIAMMIGGAIRVVGAITTNDGHKVLGFVTGFIDILLGFWLFSGIPFTGIAIGFFLGIDLLMAGITWMLLGWQLRRLPDEAIRAGLETAGIDMGAGPAGPGGAGAA